MAKEKKAAFFCAAFFKFILTDQKKNLSAIILPRFTSNTATCSFGNILPNKIWIDPRHR